MFPKVEGRRLAADPPEQHLQVMIRLRQDRVVEPGHPAGQNDGTDEERGHHARQGDAARLDGGDLEVALHPAEDVQDRDEHGHRERLGEDEGDRVDEDLGDHGPVEVLADEPLEALAHLIEEEQHRGADDGEDERPGVTAQDVAGESSHRPEITVFSGRCQPWRVFPGPVSPRRFVTVRQLLYRDAGR